MIPVMQRLKVHHLAEGGLPQEIIAERLGISVRSVRRILGEAAPAPDELRADERQSGPRRGRPSVAEPFRKDIAEILAEEPGLPTTEVLRRVRLRGYAGRRTAVFDLVKKLRPPKVKEPIVRFEGMPGEFAQFDFGEAWVKFAQGGRRKVPFFVGRLKYSRFIHVVLCKDQKAERLIRALVACLCAFGGAPKEWVFDNAKTIRISPISDPQVVFHPYLRDLVAEMNVLPTLCTPAAGNQKGSVENGVGFAKKNFFFARKFNDFEHLQAELAQWLHEVNTERPCDATKELPDVLRQKELPWLLKRPVRFTAETFPLRESRVISPMATVSFDGTSYTAPPRRIGATATLFVTAGHVELVVDQERCRHVRQDLTGQVMRLPEHRTEMLAVIHGQRKVNYFRRQCLLELGPEAATFLEQLVHRHPGGTWSPVVNELFDLLQKHSPTALRAALAACHREGRYDALSVHRQLRRVA